MRSSLENCIRLANLCEYKEIKDIDGNLIDIKQAIFEYEDKYGDGLSVIGGLIKKDLLSQLDISLSTMKNIESILSNLNLSDYYSSSYSIEPISQRSVYEQRQVTSVNFNESLITVNGNVDKNMLPDLKNMIKQAEIEITKNIIKSFR